MPNTLIVGIDISSQSNSIFFIDDAGNHLIKKPFSLPNHQEGANELIKRVIDCLSQYNLSYVKFGMEATCYFAWHLHLFLASSSELLPYKPTFYVLNPSVVKGFKKIYTFLPKTDNIDAIIIAECVRFSKLNPTPLPDFKYAALQRLTRMHYHLVHNLTREKKTEL